MYSHHEHFLPSLVVVVVVIVVDLASRPDAAGLVQPRIFRIPHSSSRASPRAP
jgi:hypothetical protein